MAARTPPTEQQLRAAFQRAGLLALGLRFEQAMADPALRASLVCMANADRHWAEQTLRHGSRRLEIMNKDRA